jgi:hypothetical protein
MNPLPHCMTPRCVRSASYLCVWGCLQGDLHEGFFCANCALAHVDAVKQSLTINTTNITIYGGGMMVCRYGHAIADLVETKLNDPQRMYDYLWKPA